jgi:fused signal recognition particle receptor
LKQAQEKKIDVVLCDTSGRLQNKVNLMNELKKINNIIKKFEPNQPVESLLVLDSTSGQNGIQQANAFKEITHITGIVLTKTDSSSKGGIVLAIKDAFNIPIKFIGLGEGIDDLEPFDLEMYINGLVKQLDFLEKN